MSGRVMSWQQGGEGGSRGEEEEGPLYRHKDPLPCSPHTSPSSHLAHHLCGGSEGRVQAGARASDAPQRGVDARRPLQVHVAAEEHTQQLSPPHLGKRLLYRRGQKREG